MTGIAAIDESGDLGKNGTRFFIMSAVMSNRSRNLLQTSKMIGNRGYERKYKNSSQKEISDLLLLRSKSNAVITYVVVDKYDFNSQFYNTYGNDLYLKVLEHLLNSISTTSPAYEMSILLDGTSSISQHDFEIMCNSVNGIKIRKCTKNDSSSNKCIQIADYVAGAIWHMYERNERNHFQIIEKSIRRP